MSAVAFFGILLFFLTRRQEGAGFTVCVAVLFGFLLASTGAAPAIHNLLNSAAGVVGPHG
ncbi:hypothetical protein [Kitasatospora sp. NPDC050543]|uniref:hypothetical protein n=1 Tax=Kitasatospora sp. NPDC050543 TaxID=3364054 RepID=UPI0037B16141